MEELRNENIETTEGYVDEAVGDEVPETGNGGIAKVVIGAIGLAAVGAGTYLWKKTKAKRNKYIIKKLKKEGYSITEPVKEPEDLDIVDEDDIESDK